MLRGARDPGISSRLIDRRPRTRGGEEAAFILKVVGDEAVEEDDRLCTLVMIGVRPDGTKERITVEDA